MAEKGDLIGGGGFVESHTLQASYLLRIGQICWTLVLTSDLESTSLRSSFLTAYCTERIICGNYSDCGAALNAINIK